MCFSFYGMFFLQVILNLERIFFTQECNEHVKRFLIVTIIWDSYDHDVHNYKR